MSQDLTVQTQTLNISDDTRPTYNNIYVYTNGIINMFTGGVLWGGNMVVSGSGAEVNAEYGTVNIVSILPGGGGLFDQYKNPIQNLVFLETLENFKVRSQIIDLPTANQDILQTLGTKNRVLTSKFVILNRMSFTWNTLEGLIGQIGYIQTALIPSYLNVLFLDVNITVKAERPLEYEAEIDMVEII